MVIEIREDTLIGEIKGDLGIEIVVEEIEETVVSVIEARRLSSTEMMDTRTQI
jgi:predicted HTH domain antitoxin